MRLSARAWKHGSHSRGDQRTTAAATLNRIGAIYDDLGNQQQALDSYKQALSLFLAVGGPDDVSATLKTIDTIKGELKKQHKTVETPR